MMPLIGRRQVADVAGQHLPSDRKDSGVTSVKTASTKQTELERLGGRRGVVVRWHSCEDDDGSIWQPWPLPLTLELFPARIWSERLPPA